jgi:hypothetical protein
MEELATRLTIRSDVLHKEQFNQLICSKYISNFDGKEEIDNQKITYA